MLRLQVMYTDNPVINRALDQHFNGNVLQMLEASVISITGRTIDELDATKEEEYRDLAEKLFPYWYDGLSALQIIKPIKAMITGDTYEAPDIIEEYVIAGVMDYFCKSARSSGTEYIIPFLLREELLEAYMNQPDPEGFELTEEEKAEDALERIFSIENVEDWPDLIFEDWDYEFIKR